MTTPINKILTNHKQTLSVAELANVSASLSAILGQGGGGGGGGEPCASAWLPSVDENGNLSWTLSMSTTTPDTANIIGPQGPNGQDGAKGEDGTSIILQSVTDVAGGKQVTLAWGETPSTSSFVIPSGTPGTDGQDGDDGYSPTVSTTTITDGERTGTKITFTFGEGGSQTTSYSSWNGKDGTGATDYFASTTISGDGTQALPYGVDTGVIATQAWVGDQNFLTAASTTGSISGDGTTNSIGLVTSAEQALAAVNGKVSKPPVSQQQGVYVVWDKGQSQSWTDFNVAANKWANNFLFDEEYPIVDGINGLSAGLVPGEFNDIYKVGVDTTNMTANKQYAFTTTGWKEVEVPSTSGYLPLSGGTVSGQLEISATSGNFDSQFLKLIREGVAGHGRVGLGQNGALALKADDANQHTTQVNINPNAANDQLVQVQHGLTTAYLIPAQVHQGSYTPSENDGILHIIVEN